MDIVQHELVRSFKIPRKSKGGPSTPKDDTSSGGATPGVSSGLSPSPRDEQARGSPILPSVAGASNSPHRPIQTPRPPPGQAAQHRSVDRPTAIRGPPARPTTPKESKPLTPSTPTTTPAETRSPSKPIFGVQMNRPAEGVTVSVERRETPRMAAGAGIVAPKRRNESIGSATPRTQQTPSSNCRVPPTNSATRNGPPNAKRDRKSVAAVNTGSTNVADDIVDRIFGEIEFKEALEQKKKAEAARSPSPHRHFKNEQHQRVSPSEDEQREKPPKVLTRELLNKLVLDDSVAHEFLNRDSLMERLLGHKMLNGRIDSHVLMGYVKAHLPQIPPDALSVASCEGGESPEFVPPPPPAPPRMSPGKRGPKTPPLSPQPRSLIPRGPRTPPESPSNRPSTSGYSPVKRDRHHSHHRSSGSSAGGRGEGGMTSQRMGLHPSLEREVSRAIGKCGDEKAVMETIKNALKNVPKREPIDEADSCSARRSVGSVSVGMDLASDDMDMDDDTAHGRLPPPPPPPPEDDDDYKLTAPPPPPVLPPPPSMPLPSAPPAVIEVHPPSISFAPPPLVYGSGPTLISTQSYTVYVPPSASYSQVAAPPPPPPQQSYLPQPVMEYMGAPPPPLGHQPPPPPPPVYNHPPPGGYQSQGPPPHRQEPIGGSRPPPSGGNQQQMNVNKTLFAALGLCGGGGGPPTPTAPAIVSSHDGGPLLLDRYGQPLPMPDRRIPDALSFRGNGRMEAHGGPPSLLLGDHARGVPPLRPLSPLGHRSSMNRGGHRGGGRGGGKNKGKKYRKN